MHSGRWTSLGAVGSGVGMLAENGLDPERTGAVGLVPFSSALSNVGDHGTEGHSLLLLGKMSERGKRSEDEDMGVPVSVGLDRPPLLSIEVLAGRVMPGSEDAVVPLEEFSHTVGSGPLLGRVDEAFLGALFEEVSQPGELGGGLVGDDDGLVSARPEALSPSMEPSDLSGDVGVDELHEGGKRALMARSEQEVHVVGHDAVEVDVDAVPFLGSSEDTADDVVDSG